MKACCWTHSPAWLCCSSGCPGSGSRLLLGELCLDGCKVCSTILQSQYNPWQSWLKKRMLLQLWCNLDVDFERAFQSIQGIITGSATVLLSAMLLSGVPVLTIATAIAWSNSASYMPFAVIPSCQLIVLVPLIDWISDTLSKKYTNLQSLVKCLYFARCVQSLEGSSFLYLLVPSTLMSKYTERHCHQFAFAVFGNHTRSQ